MVSIVKPHAGRTLPERAYTEARAALRQHIAPSVGLVVVPEPFFALTSSTSPEQTCCTPSQHILTRAAAIRDSLPPAYACLHARVEEDWFNYCCSMLETPASAVSFELERERKMGLTRHRPTFGAWIRSGARGAAPAPPLIFSWPGHQRRDLLRSKTQVL